MKRYLETGKHSVLNRLVEVEALRADGSHIPVELSITEVPVPEGRLFTAVLRDISERKRFQAQLAVAERQRAQLTRHFSPNMVEELMQARRRIGHRAHPADGRAVRRPLRLHRDERRPCRASR